MQILLGVGRRVLYLIPVLFIVSLGTFLMLDLVPGDPVVHILGPDATPEQMAAVRLELGLDQPLVPRYFDWLFGVLQGDFGRSLLPPVEDVSEMLARRFPVTLELAIVAMVLSLAFSTLVALVAVYRAGRRFDKASNVLALVVLSTPSFLIALLLVFFLVFRPGMVKWAILGVGLATVAWLVYRALVKTRDLSRGERRGQLALGLGVAAAVAVATVVLWQVWPAFPRQGFARLGDGGGLWNHLEHLFLPAVTLALVEGAVFARVLRNDLGSTLKEDFVLFARAKGMPGRRVLLSDALRPSSFTLITVAGVSFGRLLGGTIIVETIFNLPGMGTMIVRAVGAGDFRVVQAGVLVIAVFYVVINSLIDISYSYLDPRVRRG
ncbi:ABC transporter permease subunit [Nocardioides sp. zg-579]|uniref:ABC transporter permease subunit n=1 Tax=Nocardioides marmotae TaxID=2663857 RepID=A0A6I3J970_9ACTN|nr:ABC transporter permease [Nocardioides marmotae]MCR6030107.1 ABC transporter permease subunit [Gordonia jinghuaiqii]MTB93738.1 ABC transporter permease subunit [Nocardioides marmotae]QKE00081.1 ABC transporter permease [Nocardioides marmotae]